MIMSSSNNNNPPPITSPPTGGQQKQNDSSGSEGGGGVKVYKLVNDSGELQLLNEDEYDVVSVNSNTADNDYDGDDHRYNRTTDKEITFSFGHNVLFIDWLYFRIRPG